MSFLKANKIIVLSDKQNEAVNILQRNKFMMPEYAIVNEAF
jgi:hypothetical protein